MMAGNPRPIATRSTIAQAPANGATATLTLTLPLPPNMANGRGHWRKKDRERKAYLAACDARQAAGLVPPPPAVPLPWAELHAAMVMWAFMDCDNAIARLKWAVDWLVTRGYLEGDSRKHLAWTLPHQRPSHKDEPSVTFTLRPAPAGGVGGVGE
jgi:hypothetical protein